MRLVRSSTFGVGLEREISKDDIISYLKDLSVDVDKLFDGMQGRLRFGTATDGREGENISGQFQVFTSDATPNAEFTVAHTIGAVPQGYIIIYQDKAGSLYGTATLGTAWTASNLYLKCSVASVTFGVFLLK